VDREPLLNLVGVWVDVVEGGARVGDVERAPVAREPPPLPPDETGTSRSSRKSGSEYSSTTLAFHVSWTSLLPTTSIPSAKWWCFIRVEAIVQPDIRSTERTCEWPYSPSLS